MSEELKCPYCEGTASIAYNNLLYCHDCKRTFSERDAKIMKQAARVAELEAERDRLREALKEIAKFADSEYEKRIPAPSCVEFSTVKRYAEKALKGAGECRK